MLVGARAHFDHIRQEEGGTLLQLGDISPAHHQFDWRWKQKGRVKPTQLRTLNKVCMCIYIFFGGIFLYILLPEPVWYRIILLKFNDVGIFLFCFKSVMTLNCIVNLQNNKNMFKNLTVNNKRSGGFQNHLLFLTNVNKSRGGWCWGRAIPAGGPSPSSSCRSNSWPASLLQAFQTASETWRWPPWTCQYRHRL